MRKLTSILDTRYSILDTRYSILDTRYSILDTRYSILLFLLIILTFSNCVFASEDDSFEKKCKVEYTQLDLITGTEVVYKNTSQFFEIDHCEVGFEKIAPKLDKWVDENNTNIITKINEFKCKAKSINREWIFVNFAEWSRYRDCRKYKQKLSAYLVDKYPNKIGTKIFQDSIAD
jgi:hypothetical protein